MTWRVRDGDLLGGKAPPESSVSFSVPAAYVRLAENVVCHRDPERFALLYELLWRITHGERELLSIASDPLVHRLQRMEKSVRRDMHKMTAFLRFRRVEAEDGEHFIAWFEPEHFILRRDRGLLRRPLRRDALVDPHAAGRAALGRQGTDRVSAGVSHKDAPASDALEDWWRTYYRATFNPARANLDAMRAQMPKKYWHNMPETDLIPGLLAEADARTRRDGGAGADRAAPRERHRDAASTRSPRRTSAASRPRARPPKHCERCPLYKHATQTVFGEGPAHAPVVFVGEQPGDQEDLAGKPFVGPAGQMFDRALAEAGIDRTRVYVTNAVKHFKFEPRGKRRIHQKPNNNEIDACRWWLDNELAPDQAAAHRGARRDRGARADRPRHDHFALARPADDAARGRRGLHHGAPLVPAAPAGRCRRRRAEYAQFVADLKLVAQHLPEIRKAA